MNFTFNDEQEELRRVVRRFFDEKSPSTEVRRLMETNEGYDDVVWKQIAQDLALQGIHIPESYGGQGGSFVELGIVLEEMGRALACTPFFATVCLATNAILNAGTDEQKAELLPAIAAGEKTATLAFAEESGSWDVEKIAVEAKLDGDSYKLNGVKSYVIDGHTANVLVVAARGGGRGEDGKVGLYLVDGQAEGLDRQPLKTVDMTRKQARLEFSNTLGRLLGTSDDAEAALAKTLDQVSVCMSAEMAGGSQRCLDMAVDYAKERIQFGRPIGAFQAVKHLCADMLLEVESAKTAAYYAMWAAADDGEDLRLSAPLAKSYCGDAFFKVSCDNIQVHGGIGFTWEHDAHLYYRRAKSSDLMFGDASYHRQVLGDRLGI
ncbi:MAG TPA: acyl-CoA dehydrogenase family protein [Actinomycetota bacterium]|nr:acyl-CoA dehydrogenase family protein [Actinomycetota bacterium]